MGFDQAVVGRFGSAATPIDIALLTIARLTVALVATSTRSTVTLFGGLAIARFA
jgi:hypothetical protein